MNVKYYSNQKEDAGTGNIGSIIVINMTIWLFDLFKLLK